MSYKFATLAPYPGGASELTDVLRLQTGRPLQLQSGSSLALQSAVPGVGSEATLESVSKGRTTLAVVDGSGPTILEVAR